MLLWQRWLYSCVWLQHAGCMKAGSWLRSKKYLIILPWLYKKKLLPVWELWFSGDGGGDREVLLSVLILDTFLFTISGLQQWPMPFIHWHINLSTTWH
jgi:hypothetical protein